MLDLIEPHLINDGTGFFILLGKAEQMAIKMGFDLSLGFGQKAEIPFIAQSPRNQPQRQ